MIPDILVIGAGPAGLAAAEVAADGGARVLIAERMPSPARKFLMAGKSGLNLTTAHRGHRFRDAYRAFGDLAPALDAFGPDDVIAWAEGLGQPMYLGSGAKWFPRAMKASPLLRAWLARLEARGAVLRTRWRWTGWDGGAARFDTPEGPRVVRAGATILALGGASWWRLGSDGAWAGIVDAPVAPFAPSNMGLAIDWSRHMAPHFGQAIKSVGWSAGHLSSRGEAVIGRAGLEGGGLYPLSPALRRPDAALCVDLLPDLDPDTIAARLARARTGDSATTRLRKTLGLPPVKIALWNEWARDRTAPTPAALKALYCPAWRPRPLDEAISTAGGLRFDGLGPDLQLRNRPSVFAAGEMLDWDAPTGGYLLTACLATGRQAGRSALAHLRGAAEQQPGPHAP